MYIAYGAYWKILYIDLCNADKKKKNFSFLKLNVGTINY